MLVGDDGKVQRLYERGDRRPERPRYRLDGARPDPDPGPDRRARPCHGPRHGRALARSLRHQLACRRRSSGSRAYAAANPTPRWIIGRGWNQERWGLGRFPTAADLDSIVADRPVWLERVDGHAGWANSARDARGRDHRRRARRRRAGGSSGPGAIPTGIFVDAAMPLVERAVPPPLPLQRDRALAAAQEILLSNGLTTVADMGTSAEDWAVMRRAGDAGQLNVRIISYASGIDNLLAVAGTRPTPWLYDGRLRMVGVKLYLDGALGSRGAWLKQPYRDAPGQRGLPLVTDTVLKNLMSRAAMDNFQVAVHAIGDQANAHSARRDRRACRDLSRATGAGGSSMPRSSIPPTFRASPATASSPRCSRPTRPATGGWPRRGWGSSGCGGAYAWRSMLDNNVPLAFGSDFPVESPNPFPGLAAAISREDAQGQPPGGWLPQQRLTMEQAFDAFTRGAAYAGFAEDRLGTLEPGHYGRFHLHRPRHLRRPPTSARSAARGCWRPMSAAPGCGSGAVQPPSAARLPGRQHLRQHFGLAAAAR